MKLVLLLTLFISGTAHANDAQSKRIEELERQVKTLTDKVDKMESTFNKGGGFMLTPHFTCEIDAPFNGPFTATELSEQAARASVMEKCKAVNKNNGQCEPASIKCKK